MKQKSYSSTLTEIPGIGPKTAAHLDGPVRAGAVKEATPDQLENTSAWQTDGNTGSSTIIFYA